MAGQREEYKREETGTHWSVESEVGGDIVQPRQFKDRPLGLSIGRGKRSL